jgi:hypothetical protein
MAMYDLIRHVAVTGKCQKIECRQIYYKYFKKGCEYELAIEGLDVNVNE